MDNDFYTAFGYYAFWVMKYIFIPIGVEVSIAVIAHKLLQLQPEGQKKRFKVEDSMEEISFIWFYDIGALGYYMKAFPWVFQDFSVKNYRDVLYNIHKQIQKEGFVDIIYHLFFLDVRKAL